MHAVGWLPQRQLGVLPSACRCHTQPVRHGCPHETARHLALKKPTCTSLIARDQLLACTSCLHGAVDLLALFLRMTQALTAQPALSKQRTCCAATRQNSCIRVITLQGSLGCTSVALPVITGGGVLVVA